MTKRLIFSGIFLFVVLTAAVMTGCGGGGGQVIPPPGLSPNIEPGVAPPAFVGVPYSLGFRWTVNTAKPPYFWNLNGNLPPGLQFDPVNGRIYGTPTTQGAFSFTVIVRDSNLPQREESRAYTITVGPPPGGALTLTPVPSGRLPICKVGVPYSYIFLVTGGLPPYSFAIQGMVIPGLTFDQNTGTLAGTPTTTGQYSFTVRVFDSQVPPNTDTETYTLECIDPLQITTESPLPDGEVGVAYSQQLQAQGGVPCVGGPPYNWTFESGFLDPGLTVNANGTITGTPTTPGTYNFLVRVTDCDAPTPETVTKNLALTIKLVDADRFVCVDGINGDDAAGDGTSALPFKTITRALAYVSANNMNPSLPRIGAVRIAGPQFGPPLTYHENIVLDASNGTDVDLLGGWTGFSGNFCAFRGNVPNARIKGLAVSGPTITTIGLTRDTWIELLEVEGNNAPFPGSVAILNNRSSPTIARNTIRGGNASGANAVSMGIYDDGNNPLIIENTIYGGTGSAGSRGIWVDFGSTAEIRDNTIDGGDPSGGGPTTSAGVKSSNGANPLIYDNTIIGGTGFNAYGIWVDPADANIARNIINCKGSATTDICAGIYIRGSKMISPIKANIINENRPETPFDARGNSTRGIWVDQQSTVTILGHNPSIYGGEGTSTSYGILVENVSTVTIGAPGNPPGGSNDINGGGCNLGGTVDSYGIKSSSGSTVNSLFNTINGGCGTNSSNGFAIDPATGNSDGDNINGGGIPGTTALSRGVWCDGAGSTGSIAKDAIDGGKGNTAIAKMVTNGCVLTESGNTYTGGGQNSYGLWYENCSAGTIIENHDGVNDGIIYGGNGSGTSTGLKLKNCNAEVRSNVIDGGSAPNATGIDVDASSPWIHNNIIRGSQAATTTNSATGVAYSNGSGGTLGSIPSMHDNDIVGATGSATPASSTGVFVDNSSPNISGNGLGINGGQGAFTTGILITNGANPGLVAVNTISGGTATSQSVGIFSDSATWSGTVSGNNISGGTCTGCDAYGIWLNDGTPTIGPNNSISGGSGKFARGVYVWVNANPTITGNTSINGGTGTSASIGIEGATASWTGTVLVGNTISGGTCTGCNAYGIWLSDGTPTIGPNNSISGGSGSFTKGIFVIGFANPTITGNTNISGGSALFESIGIKGASASWSGTVSGNTISGGTCTAVLCTAYGIVLGIGGGTPAIGGPNLSDGNTISAGSATNSWGVLMSTTPSDFRNNTITGGSGGGFDVDDRRTAGSGCINATGTKTTNASGPQNPDDSLFNIGDSDFGSIDGDVDGPFTFGTELKIWNNGNCLIGIDTGA
jgi:hypothetical protein